MKIHQNFTNCLISGLKKLFVKSKTMALKAETVTLIAQTIGLIIKTDTSRT